MAKKAISLEPDLVDGYMILGIAYADSSASPRTSRP